MEQPIIDSNDFEVRYTWSDWIALDSFPAPLDRVRERPRLS